MCSLVRTRAFLEYLGIISEGIMLVSSLSHQGPINTGNASEEEPNIPNNPANATEEGTSTESTITTGANSAITNVSTAAETTTAGTSTEATPTSESTTTTSVSTTVEITSTGTTRKQRRRPRPKKNQYGTLIDKNGCKHKILQSKDKLYTATCTGVCEGRTYPIVDGTACLRIAPKGRGKKKRGKKCFEGVCYRGRCHERYTRKVNCKVPQGTVHYYDDYSYNGGAYYDYLSSYEQDDDHGSFAE
uniref:Evasin n=1 Tax=Amblyomma cajennense TaxID=34607 RepID=A0A023FQX1_AMBCJ